MKYVKLFEQNWWDENDFVEWENLDDCIYRIYKKTLEYLEEIKNKYNISGIKLNFKDDKMYLSLPFKNLDYVVKINDKEDIMIKNINYNYSSENEWFNKSEYEECFNYIVKIINKKYEIK